MLIDWFTVAAQVVNFLILVWLLKRFLYRPVLAAIDEREKRIAAQLQDAEKKKAEASKEQADFLQKNEEFERKSSTLLLEATNGTRAEREKLVATARQEAEELRAKLQKTVEAEANGLKAKLGMMAQAEVFSIARKTLADLANVSLEERMAEIFVLRLREMPEKQREELKTSSQAAGARSVVRSVFDLTPTQKKAIEEATGPFLMPGAKVGFELKPGLISGIEWIINGQKVAWSIDDYLASLTQSVEKLLDSKFEPAPAAAEVANHAT